MPISECVKAASGAERLEPPTARYFGRENRGVQCQTRCVLICPLPISRSQMEKDFVDAPKQCIDAYGPITRQNLSSANKRVRPVGSDE